MKVSKCIVVMVVGVGLWGSGAWAGITLDQEQNLATHTISNFRNDTLAQSFKQASGNIAGAGLYILPFFDGDATSVSADFTISVRSAHPSHTEPIYLLSTETVSLTNLSAPQWVDVFYTSPVSVNPAQTLYLVFEVDNMNFDADATDNNIYLRGSIHDPYGNGKAYTQPNWTGQSSMDYAFHTYTSTVPVPGAVMLGMFGTGFVSWMRKRRTI